MLATHSKKMRPAKTSADRIAITDN
jgi:hypothetical protein